MGLLDDCQVHFGTKDLYEVLGVKKSASGAEIKKGYRRLSLKHHPDRHDAADSKTIQDSTRIFQTLSKVHFILSDDEKRKLYDSTGIVDADDALDSQNADWNDYFRALFPKVTKKDIDSFYQKYLGSQEEKDDLKKVYIRFEGDMDKISECMIGFEEERSRKMIQELIDEKEVPDFESFLNEPSQKKNKRLKKAAKEAKAASEAQNENDEDDDLVMAIRTKSAANFNNLISQLEAKYGKPQPSKGAKGSGRKK